MAKKRKAKSLKGTFKSIAPWRLDPCRFCAKSADYEARCGPYSILCCRRVKCKAKAAAWVRCEYALEIARIEYEAAKNKVGQLEHQWECMALRAQADFQAKSVG
jgi:hypothetical protein